MIIFGPFLLGIFCNSLTRSFYFCSKTDTIPSKVDALQAFTSPGPPATLPWALRGSISAPDGKESTYQRAIIEKMPNPIKASWIWLGPGRITEYSMVCGSRAAAGCSVFHLAMAQVLLLAGNGGGRGDLAAPTCICPPFVSASLLQHLHRAEIMQHYSDGKYL